jgi:hypothetical protein
MDRAVMNKSYVIQWKSKLNGRSGKGTKLFEWDEAAGLADELNREYPAIHHEPVAAIALEERAPAPQENKEGGAVEAGPQAQANYSPDYVLSSR